MALIECKECKKQVSSDAKTCPHCGVTINKARNWFWEIIKWAVILFFGIMVIGFFAGNGKDHLSSRESQCQDMVTNLLKAPSTADFGSVYLDSLGVVRGYVDAQNGFGAQIRNTFSCGFDAGADGEYKIKSVCIDGKDILGGVCL